MKQSCSSPNYGRWAVTGVIVPVLVIVILRFAIVPIWGSEVASRFGSFLGYIFIFWLLFLVIAATAWKICHEKRGDEKNERKGS
jgi:hypothetical protein